LITRLAALAVAAVLAGCSGVTQPPVHYLPASFADLPGWSGADPRAALSAFRLGCTSQRPASAPLPIDTAALRDGLARACRAAAGSAQPDAASARAFLEAHFTAWRVEGPNGAEGLFTGYYEPTLEAARTRQPGFDTPIYALPPGAKPGAVLAARADIENGTPKDWRVLFWARDPVDVFTLHVQGSGRVALAEGGFARVSYAGNNGHGYVAIGRLMRERGLLPEGGTNMPAIQAWLRANPEAGRALMQENPRYIFFREVPASEGPKGQPGAALTPRASLAVDPAFIPLGLPLWLDTTWPLETAKPMRMLVVAQDTGAAIKGPVRGDVFFGSDADAARNAGHMAQRGRYFLLLPKVVK
jgi:membrane-bound lytic murein transglycosylase A